MKLWNLLTPLSLSLSFACLACDAQPERAEFDASLELAADGEEAAPPRHGEQKRGHERLSAERVCELVSCSDDQLAHVSAMMDDARERRAAARANHEADAVSRAELMKAANVELAARFRGDTLTAADLETYREGIHGAHKRRGDGARGEGRDALLLELHAILTPEQRATLAV